MPKSADYVSYYDKVLELFAQDTDACVLSPFGIVRGYSHVYHEGRRVRAHRLACWRHYGPPPTERHHAAHRCGHSNCVNWRHLRWATQRQNEADKVLHGTRAVGERHGRSKLTARDVSNIRVRVANNVATRGPDTKYALAIEFGVSRAAIRSIIDGHSWVSS